MMGTVPKSIYKRLPKRMPKSLGFSRYALAFDGSEDYVGVPDDPSLDLTGEVTIMGWFRHSAGLTEEPDGWYGGIGKGNNYKIGWNGWTDGWSMIVYSGGDKYWVDSDDQYMKAGVWNHVAGVYDGADVIVYLNGEEVARNNVGALTLDTNDVSFKIAYVNNSYWNGTIDSVHLYDRALSESEIRRNMLDYHDPTRNGLVGWWRFEEGKGSTAYDRSGNGNDGTLNPSGDPPVWTNVKKWELRAEAGL